MTHNLSHLFSFSADLNIDKEIMIVSFKLFMLLKGLNDKISLR